MTKKGDGKPKEAGRAKLPVPVRHQLLMEAGYKCGNPTCRNVLTLEVHHIQYVSESGGGEPPNLLVLCPYCHSMHHAGHIPIEAIRLWKGLLVALNQGFGRQSMELLLFLHKTQDNQLWYSADGLLSYAGLIGAGLVVIAQTEVTSLAPSGRGKFTQTSHKLALTERGSLLIEAWLAGNEQRYRELVSGDSSQTGVNPV